MNKNEEIVVRPLARVVARELTQEEIEQVAAGAGCTGGNGIDCTTGGVSPSDRDVLE